MRKPPAKAVDGEERRDAPEDPPGRGGGGVSAAARGRLDRPRQPEVGAGREEDEDGIGDHRGAVGGLSGDEAGSLDERGEAREQAAEGVAGVLQDVVARDDPGPAGVGRRGGERRQLEDEGAAPVAPHGVGHPDEGGGGEGEGVGRQGEGEPAGRGGEREPEERPAGPDAVAPEGHDAARRGPPRRGPRSPRGRSLPRRARRGRGTRRGGPRGSPWRPRAGRRSGRAASDRSRSFTS